MTVDNLLPAFTLLREPLLEFHPDRAGDRHIHPLEGLLQFGPFSRSFGWPRDPIRIGAIVPEGWSNRVHELIEELGRSHDPVERTDYLRVFPGFSTVFGLRVVVEQDAIIEVPMATEEALKKSPEPYLFLCEQLAKAVGILRARHSSIDLAFLIIPESWQAGFSDADSGPRGLHDYLKSVSAVNGIPLQIVRESGGLSYPGRCSVMWHLSIAIYSKSGGIPWKLYMLNPDTVFIGIAYSIRSPLLGQRPFVVCASQVFDADGTGLEFVAFETNRAEGSDGENPFLNHGDMLRLISRSLGLYQRRHGGNLPHRVVIHKTSRFTPQEIDGCFDAIPNNCEVDLLHVQQEVKWSGTKWAKESGEPGPTRFPIDRGTMVPFGQFETLLWTQGDSMDIAPAGRHFFKEASGVPGPLSLHRYAGHGDFTQSCGDILGLTKMNWNNDSLYDRLPVTIRYAQIAARVLKQSSRTAEGDYSYRYFM
jgi:hypothetical protein